VVVVVVLVLVVVPGIDFEGAHFIVGNIGVTERILSYGHHDVIIVIMNIIMTLLSS